MLESYIQELHTNIDQSNANEGVLKSKSGILKSSENKIPDININRNKVVIRKPFISQNENECLILAKPKMKINKISSAKQF